MKPIEVTLKMHVTEVTPLIRADYKHMRRRMGLDRHTANLVTAGIAIGSREGKVSLAGV